MKPLCIKQCNIPYVEARMNSKAAQLRENGTEIVRLFARFALGASFLSAVADRFGLWGPYGAKNVSWGNFAHFVEYTGAVTSLFPSSSTVLFAWAATVAETLFGMLLIAGFKIRMASVLSGLLLLSFAIGMVTGLGIKTPFDYSVFSAAAAAFLLAFWVLDRFTLANLLNRSRNVAEGPITTNTNFNIVNGPRNRRGPCTHPFRGSEHDRRASRTGGAFSTGNLSPEADPRWLSAGDVIDCRNSLDRLAYLRDEVVHKGIVFAGLGGPSGNRLPRVLPDRMLDWLRMRIFGFWGLNVSKHMPRPRLLERLRLSDRLQHGWLYEGIAFAREGHACPV